MAEAYKECKWGFVPDYARFDIIYNHGGFYLDTDVELIASLDILRHAMTSRYEGFPMVLLEAVTMGLPLISYDCHTGPSEIIKNGINGFLIEDENENLYVEKLLELIKDEDLRQRMGKESIKMASSFNIKTIGDKWEKLLKTL